MLDWANNRKMSVVLMVFAIVLVVLARYSYVRTKPLVVSGLASATPDDSSMVIKNNSVPILPSRVLDLSNWKITIPIPTKGDAKEIKQPRLATYFIDPWFKKLDGSSAVQFRAPVNGSTTSGSDYPRSELREMVGNGSLNASWSPSNGVHTLVIDQAITAVPIKKKEVVAGQIHDDKNDIIVVRLNYPVLHIRVGSVNVHTLDSNYTLGTRFRIKFVASAQQTKVYYNDSTEPVYVLNKKFSNAYFKAGVYTQSNCSKENPSDCNLDNYGEVVIYNLLATHDPYPSN